MKKAIVASILAFCPLTAFAQTSADSIPRMFSQMKGDLIRAAYLFRCFIPIPARGRKRKMNISKPMGRHPTLMRSYRNNRMV